MEHDVKGSKFSSRVKYLHLGNKLSIAGCRLSIGIPDGLRHSSFVCMDALFNKIIIRDEICVGSSV